MPEFFNQLTTKSSLYGTLEALRENINYNMNCCKVAIVESFNPENLTVTCRIANKKIMGLNADGNQQLQDYPLIYAKVHFVGWGDVGITYPITKGMEGFLLFNDREMETWFLTGDSGNLAYDRNHDLSDAIFIVGLHSQPCMIELVADCMDIFFKTSYIQLKQQSIDFKATSFNFEGNTSQTGNNTTNGTVTANSLVDTSAYSGSFVTKDDKTVTVQNGIIKSVS